VVLEGDIYSIRYTLAGVDKVQALWGIPPTKEGRILRKVSKGTGSSATSVVKDSPPGVPEPLVGFIIAGRVEKCVVCALQSPAEVVQRVSILLKY
jgi:hypothetical protein